MTITHTTPPTVQRTVHIVNAHLTYPNWSEGGLNADLAARAAAHLRDLGHVVTEVKVEDGYDPEIEVQRHLDADLVILQTPINWFGAPWIYKRYVDDVFNTGLHRKQFMTHDGRSADDPTRQYGTGGLMHGKSFMVSATWNAPAETFDNPDGTLLGGKSVDDVLLALTASYRFVGYTVLESHGLFDIFRDAQLSERVAAYPEHVGRQLAHLDAGMG